MGDQLCGSWHAEASARPGGKVICQDEPVTLPPDPMAAATAPRPRRRWPRRWLVVLTFVWVVVLVGSALFALRYGTPTGRDQTSVEQARPTVDEAVARIASAAAAEGAVVAVSPFEHVGACDITVFRGGERYRRGVTAMVPPNTESDLLSRVAGRLPASYGAVVRTGEAPRLTADAGFWVLVTATMTAPGEVRFYADTGDCRKAGRVDATDPAATVDEAPIRAVLQRLALSGSDTRTAAVSCPDGGVAGTVEVRAGPYPGALDAALRDVGDPTAVVATARVYAYLSGLTHLAVRANPDNVIVTATTPC